MTSNKGKHNFWSQLLVSMIAIFALPAAQGLEYPDNVRSENHQSQAQQIQRQIFTAVSLIRQAARIQRPVTSQGEVESSKLFKIEPHFSSAAQVLHAPIRGSPSA
ncbi:MAG TPA: DUF2547 domain-containing protein [Pasteurellaceae bacterium]|nr:DUF2547 domain-containing protein [Pasteurellaceae bacterium]